MTVIDRPWLFRDDDGRRAFGPRGMRNRDRTDPSGGMARSSARYSSRTIARRSRSYSASRRWRFRHGEAVGPLLEEWRWRDSMHGPAEKQRFLELLIQRAKRDPDANEGVLIFLLLVCEGVRRGVVRELSPREPGLRGRRPRRPFTGVRRRGASGYRA